ncbi:MAG: response regulator [Bacteroidia bacterium]
MKRILYVEDDKINALVVSKFVEAFYSIQVANSQAEALAILEDQEFDLFILDISLGYEDEDGVDLMKKIKLLPHCRDKKFIALTAHALREDRDKYLALGFDGYLSKPINRKVLLESIAGFMGDEVTS